ncbi:TPA: hypothetical protein ACVO3J_004491 [Vibrio alginolyticus]|uniref:hypothetical protein n=1 Tax=Vibrio harveyi group TaxID=717610 RepID=UPI0020231120|nr:hypothetical protein [Vibrio alginolyticus]MEA3482351.1 hypothetical protein [Pseudomonadota bacterium]
MRTSDTNMKLLSSQKDDNQADNTMTSTIESRKCDNGTAFDAELFLEMMTRGGSGSEYLCQWLLSWRDYSLSSLKELKQFTLASAYYKLDSSSRYQAINMLHMDMHDPVFQELEGVARKQLGI